MMDSHRWPLFLSIGLRCVKADRIAFIEDIMRILITLLLLSGCSSGWEHPTKSGDDFYKDVYRCDQEVQHILEPLEKSRVWRNCLRAQGWRET